MLKGEKMIKGVIDTIIYFSIATVIIMFTFTILFEEIKEGRMIEKDCEIKCDEKDAIEQRNKEIAEIIEEKYVVSPQNEYSKGYNKALQDIHDKIMF